MNLLMILVRKILELGGPLEPKRKMKKVTHYELPGQNSFLLESDSDSSVLAHQSSCPTNRDFGTADAF